MKDPINSIISEFNKTFPFIILHHFEASGNEGENFSNLEIMLEDFLRKSLKQVQKKTLEDLKNRLNKPCNCCDCGYVDQITQELDGIR